MQTKPTRIAVAFEGELEPEDAQEAGRAIGVSVARLSRLSSLDGPREPSEALVVCQQPGQSFTRGAPIAIRKAREMGYSRVALKFNGVFPMIDVSGPQSAQELSDTMFAESQRLLDEAAKAYAATPQADAARLDQAGLMAQMQAQEAQALARTQARLTAPGFDSDPAFYKSLGALAISLDRLGGHTSPSIGIAIGALRAAGFKDNEGVGSSQVNDGEHPEQRGRYLVGQLLAMSSQGSMNPKVGGMLVNLADRWDAVDVWPASSPDPARLHARRELASAPAPAAASPKAGI